MQHDVMQPNLAAIIVQQLQNKAGIAAVLLFGSYATGRYHRASDVDLALLFEAAQIPTAVELFALQQQLAASLNCNVDLICLNRADPIIGSQIYQYHQVLLVNNQHLLDNYFARMIADYAEIKEYRRPMEQAILKRKYYG